MLVYFGYPAAHEDDAARAIRAGLEIVTALDQARSRFIQPVQVRVGIHTGPVVVGQMGGGSRHEQLALSETPNIAARVQGQAEPDHVVISAATQRLVTGLFETTDQGRHELKGISTPQALYRVVAEGEAQNRFEAAVRSGLTPLVGRAEELAFVHQRWIQAQAGAGQVMLLSGEPGIGKSRLVQELKAQVSQEGATQIEFRCSPYHQNSALYPITEHLQRLLQFTPDDTPETKLDKLQQTLRHYRFPQPNTFPLLAALLSLPHPEGVPLLTVSPQQQKELTQTALVAWLIEETARQPVYNSWEDLHWADPSTLEVLELLLSQVPTTRLLAGPDVPPGVYPALGDAFVSESPDAQSLSAGPRQRDGGAGDGRQTPARGSGTTDSDEDGWRAAVCRRVNQDGGRVGLGVRREQPLRADRPAAALGDSLDPTRFAHGPFRPLSDGAGRRPAGCDDRAGVFLRTPGGGLCARRSDPPTGAAAVSGDGIPVSARIAAAGPLHL